MHSSVLISCHLVVVWRIAQIHNKKNLSFWAGVAKTGSALIASACCMLAKSIFCTQQTKKSEKQCTNFQHNLKWHNTEFTTAHFVILKIIKNKLKKVTKNFPNTNWQFSDFSQHSCWYLLNANVNCKGWHHINLIMLSELLNRKCALYMDPNILSLSCHHQELL